MLRRLFPHPYLAGAVPIVWLLLANSLSLGNIAFGLVLAIVIPVYTARFWPERPRLRRPWQLASYGAVVAKDILIANLEVARIVLFKRNRVLRPVYVAVPLDLRTPEAIMVLTATITLTPGTISADLSADGCVVLVHGLDVADPDRLVRDIKERYEPRLKEVFE